MLGQLPIFTGSKNVLAAMTDGEQRKGHRGLNSKAEEEEDKGNISLKMFLCGVDRLLSGYAPAQ